MKPSMGARSSGIRSRIRKKLHRRRWSALYSSLPP
jgi:hypothetical protein